jgi:hypothetical protein
MLLYFQLQCVNTNLAVVPEMLKFIATKFSYIMI